MATQVTPVTFRGTQIIGERSGTLTNGDGHASMITYSPHRANVIPAEFWNVAGMETLKIGQHNTADTSGTIEFGGEGTVAYYTNFAAARSFIDSIESLMVANPVGTLVYGGTTINNVWFQSFEPSPPRVCSIDSLGACLTMRLVFKRLVA